MWLKHMMPLLPKRIYCGIKSTKFEDERGLGTIEMVVLMAVLIGVAFMFKGYIGDLFDKITKVIDGNGYKNLQVN